MDAEDLVELLKSKDRLFYFYWNMLENETYDARKMAEHAQKNRKQINKELKDALVKFAKSYRDVKKLVRYLEKFSDRGSFERAAWRDEEE